MPLTLKRGEVHDRSVNFAYSLVASTLAVAAMSSCSDMNRPLDSSVNPLDSRGSRDAEGVDVSIPAYMPGQWLETTIPSTAFFYAISATAQPDKILPVGTVLKVITTEGTYVQVELESGDVGYVPAIMVAQRPAAGQVPIVPLGPDGFVPDPVPGVVGPAPEPEVAPLDVQPADGGPGALDPGTVIE